MALKSDIYKEVGELIDDINKKINDALSTDMSKLSPSDYNNSDLKNLQEIRNSCYAIFRKVENGIAICNSLKQAFALISAPDSQQKLLAEMQAQGVIEM